MTAEFVFKVFRNGTKAQKPVKPNYCTIRLKSELGPVIASSNHPATRFLPLAHLFWAGYHSDSFGDSFTLCGSRSPSSRSPCPPALAPASPASGPAGTPGTADLAVVLAGPARPPCPARLPLRQRGRCSPTCRRTRRGCRRPSPSPSRRRPAEPRRRRPRARRRRTGKRPRRCRRGVAAKAARAPLRPGLGSATSTLWRGALWRRRRARRSEGEGAGRGMPRGPWVASGSGPSSWLRRRC